MTAKFLEICTVFFSHEVRIILGTDKIPTNESQVKKLKALVENFFLKGNHTVGGGYHETYRVGLSEAITEIFDLLEKAKVLNIKNV